MRLSFTVFGLPPEHYTPLTERAEALAFDAVWYADHLITPLSWETPYPYSPTGKPGYNSETPISDVWALIAHAGARTRRISLGTGVYVLTLRNPFVAALAAATVQNLTGGRLLMGVGTGWMKEEYDAAGMPWEARGRRLDESLEVLRKLWTGRPVEHHGRLYDFAEVQMGGAPRKPIPLVFGGSTPQALARTARLGDGWYGPACPLEESIRHREAVERARAEAGRQGEPFRYYVRVQDPDSETGVPGPAAFRRYLEAGFEDLVTPVWKARPGRAPSLEERLGDLEQVAEAAQKGGS